MLIKSLVNDRMNECFLEDDSFPFWPFLLVFMKLNLNHRRQRFFHLESSIKRRKELILANVGSENEEGCSPPQAELFKEQLFVWIFPFQSLLCSEHKASCLEM